MKGGSDAISRAGIWPGRGGFRPRGRTVYVYVCVCVYVHTWMKTVFLSFFFFLLFIL